MERVDCIVIGAGVVGLAIARALAQHGREPLILEAASAIGTQTSSRNNEVIHAGFMYTPGSLKSRLCRVGRDALYDYCQEKGVGCERIGKFVIATNDHETAVLKAFLKWAALNGVNDLECHDGHEVSEREPNLRCASAIYSPRSGIVDSHALMLALLGDAEATGATIAFASRATSISVDGSEIVVLVQVEDGEEYPIACHLLVNAAGLGAAAITNCRSGRAVPDLFFAKGNFFAFQGKPPFHSLIVPVAETLAGGGAFTIDIGGQGKFGPDVEWVNVVDYTVDEGRRSQFVEAIRRYYPAITADDLQPGYSGIRPRASKGPQMSDWVVERTWCDGRSHIINLFGIDTPGLTACLSIADHVVTLSQETGRLS
jgi:L-2-hydroxyglutarate oxidase LhgO